MARNTVTNGSLDDRLMSVENEVLLTGNFPSK